MSTAVPLLPTAGLLAIEMGGTTSRAAMFDQSQLGPVVRMPNASLAAATDFDAALVAMWQDLAVRAGDPSPANVVLAMPGPVDAGKVSALPTLTGGSDHELDAARLAASVWPGARLWICNDLTLAGYGQICADRQDFMIATIGSGFGAKLFLGGMPLLGRAGMGGEIGHWTVPGAPLLECGCGGRGHLGAIASGRGIVAWANRCAIEHLAAFECSSLASGAIEEMDAHAIVAAYHASDRWTSGMMEMPARAIAQTLSLIHLATGIEEFLLTGGMGVALGDRFCARIADHCELASWNTGLDWRRSIRCVEDADEATLSGAPLYASVTTPDHVPVAASAIQDGS